MAEEPPWGWRRGWPVGGLTGWLGGAAALAGAPWTFAGEALRSAGEALRSLAGCAVVATLLLGLTAERVLARAPVTDGVGALAGIVVALLAHLGMMLVYAVWAVPAGEYDSVGEFAVGTFGTTVLSLMWWGWVTLPLGGVAGWTAGQVVMHQHFRRATAPAGTNPDQRR